jgi:competence protein ComEC
MIELAAPEAGRSGAAARLLRWLVADLLVIALSERERWPLWVPVLLGGGIGGYFAAPVEPAPWVGVTALVFCLLLAAAVRRSPPVLLIGLAGAILAGGFATAQLRSHLAAAPVLEGRYGPASVSGRWKTCPAARA